MKYNNQNTYHNPQQQITTKQDNIVTSSLIATTTSPSPLIAASFGTTTPILHGGPGRGRGQGRGIPGCTDVKEMLASKTWVRKRTMGEELGTKR